jgi:protein-tyrosine-phosphatase
VEALAMSGAKTIRVLFLCTGNSARSILAECLANRLGGGRIHAVSAGSHPKGEVHPLSLEMLREHGYDVSGLRSKSWDEFARADAPRLDLLVTVCDQAAGEACPVWPGHPVQAHWSIEDPAAATGEPAERRAAFERVYRQLERRIRALVRLPLASLDRAELRARIERLAEHEPTPEGSG